MNNYFKLKKYIPERQQLSGLNRLYKTREEAEMIAKNMVERNKLFNGPVAEYTPYFEWCNDTEAEYVEIYQMKHGNPALRGCRFEKYEIANRNGAVYPENYDLVYRVERQAIEFSVEWFEDGMKREELLEPMFAKQFWRPEDYFGTSLSVSDIIVFKRMDNDKVLSSWYIQPNGFREIIF